MIETYKNINISVEYQWFCMKPSEQGSFSKPVEMGNFAQFATFPIFFH